MLKRMVIPAMIALLWLILVPGLAAGANTELYVVKAAQAPVIDGIVSPDEWDGAVEYVLDTDTAADCGEGDWSDVVMHFSLLWDDGGLYMEAQVQDNTVAPSVKAGKALNVTDGIQIGLNPANKKGDLISDAYFFSFVPVSEKDNTGPAVWYEHFMYKGAPEDIGVLVAGARDGTVYTVEAFIPWTSINIKDENFVPAEGAKIGAGVTNMDFDEKGRQLSVYKTWPSWMINEYNDMTFCPQGFTAPPEQDAQEEETAPASTVNSSAPDAGEADEDTSGFSHIVFIFAAILFGAVLIVIHKFGE